jgi:hypothetical protein
MSSIITRKNLKIVTPTPDETTAGGGYALNYNFSRIGDDIESLSVTLATQSANTVFAGPASGSSAAPTFRSLVANDIPLQLNSVGINRIPNSGFLLDLLKSSGAAQIRLESGNSGATIELDGTFGQLISSVGALYLTADQSLIFRTDGGTPRLTIAPTTGLATFANGISVTGTVTAGGAVTAGVVALTPGSTPALNASLGNTFALTVSDGTTNTIAVPTNPIDGQKIMIAFTASGANRTLSLNTASGGFAFGTDITGLSATTSGKTDYIGAIYDSTSNKWRVITYVKGY